MKKILKCLPVFFSVIQTTSGFAKEIYSDSKIFMNNAEEYVFTHYILYVILGFFVLVAGFFVAGKIIMKLSTKDKILALHLHEVMEQAKLIVERNDSLSETAILLSREKKEYAVVIGAMRKLEGVILKKDIDRWAVETKSGEDNSRAHTVKDIMTAPVKLGPYDNFSVAVHLFVKDNLDIIAVVDADERLVGVINKRLILSTIDRLIFMQSNIDKN
ncbi:MAG: CBS domain-containing protein [Candidatus Omnitrophica bacterium]|nr:CBS domain-containing protein [Candidatus Omnitrophota bacterium]